MLWLERLGAPLLVLAPHMDDDVLGCGGAVAQRNDGGEPVVVAYVTATDVRREQSRRALEILGGAVTHELGLPERGVFADAANVSALVRLIDDLSPAAIAVPWRNDCHPDHRATGQLLCAALRELPRRAPRILEYETFTPVAGPNLWADITREAGRKWLALEQYVEQNRLYRIVETARHLAAYRGLTTFRRRVRYAEAFRESDATTYVTQVAPAMAEAVA